MKIAHLITGSIFGVHIGIKAKEKLDSSELKTLMAILLLFVAAFMAYNHFFRNINNIYNSNNQINDIGTVANIVLDLATKYPIVYGISSIIIALGLGVGASILRKYISQKIKKTA